MAFDFKKEYKELYAPKNKPSIVNVPKMNYIAVRGKGNPNEVNGDYQKAVGVLYAVAYTLRMSYKTDYVIDGFYEYVVPPLEGFWWQDNVKGVDYSNKHKFIVDKVASKIVKKIYKDVIKGKSLQEITIELNEANILTPEMYRKVNNQASISKVESKEWNTRMIERILNNETYVGKLIQNKKRRISHKLHKSVNLDKAEWIIIDKHHEAIISKETFELVNKIIKDKEVKISKIGNYDLFAGFLKCNECGSSFVKRTSQNNTKYYCANYYRNKLCTNHKMNKENLEQIILKVINHQISLIIDFEKQVNTYSSLNNNYDYDIYMDQLTIIEKGIIKYKMLKEEIVLDLESNFIDFETFSEYRDDYNNSIIELEKSETLLKEKIQNLDGDSIKNIEWVNVFKKYSNIEKLDRNILNNLIERIVINEKGNINVIFKYQNEFYSALDFINRSKCDII